MEEGPVMTSEQEEILRAVLMDCLDAGGGFVADHDDVLRCATLFGLGDLDQAVWDRSERTRTEWEAQFLQPGGPPRPSWEARR